MINKLNAAQEAWCNKYITATTFLPLMDDYLAGNESFVDAAEKSIRWFKDWKDDAFGACSSMPIPGGESAAQQDEKPVSATQEEQPVACSEPHELVCPQCNPCRHRERLNEYDSVLRGLCSFLGAGGYNVAHQGLIDPKSADEKIRWGIDHISETERTRPSTAAQIVEMCARICARIANREREGSIRRDIALDCERAIRALSPAALESVVVPELSEDALTALVTRFLSWPLPKTFSPDCGISFDGRKPDARNYPRQWPVGTNLFSAEEARQMLLHILSDAKSAEGRR